MQTDNVRASRDGHEFHEAWVARLAMRLIMPQDDFIGIAVEGLSPADQNTAIMTFRDCSKLGAFP